jgi:hypothetical protein
MLECGDIILDIILNKYYQILSSKIIQKFRKYIVLVFVLPGQVPVVLLTRRLSLMSVFM